MTSIGFLENGTVNEGSLTYAVVISRYRGRWVVVRHRERTTWEVPAGHIEHPEGALQAARRELFEETGATRFAITPISVYYVADGADGEKTYGQLFYAEIEELGPLPDFEIGEIGLVDELPGSLTYPVVAPVLFDYVKSRVAADQD